MANPDYRFGFRPIGHANGSPWNGRTTRCYVPSGDSTAMFIGDPVVLAGSADADATAPTVTVATAGNTNPIAGVVTSFEPVTPGGHGNVNLQIEYRPASTAMYCNVVLDPSVLYEIQGDSATTIAATDVGSNFDFIATHTGSTLTGLSGMELDSSAKATTSTYQLRLMGASKNPSNDITTVNAVWVVKINLNQLFSAGVDAAGSAWAGGVGV
jgi:hypothetical protein